jgi:hypothetical protein
MTGAALIGIAAVASLVRSKKRKIQRYLLVIPHAVIPDLIRNPKTFQGNSGFLLEPAPTCLRPGQE